MKKGRPGFPHIQVLADHEKREDLTGDSLPRNHHARGSLLRHGTPRAIAFALGRSVHSHGTRLRVKTGDHGFTPE